MKGQEPGRRSGLVLPKQHAGLLERFQSGWPRKQSDQSEQPRLTLLAGSLCSLARFARRSLAVSWASCQTIPSRSIADPA